MSLSDFIQKTKKKIVDTVEPVGQKASSGLRQIANGTKNYFKNDATVGGIVKNTFKPSSLSNSLMNAPKYSFADKVNWMPKRNDSFSKRLVNNPMTKIGSTMAQGGLNAFHSVRDYSKEASNQYYGVSKPSTKKLVGMGLEASLDLGGLMTGGSKGKELIKSGLNSTKNTIGKNIWQGVKDTSKVMGRYGAGYGMADSLKNDDNLLNTAKKTAGGYATGRASGAVLGGTIPALGGAFTGVKKEAKNIAKDIMNYKDPYVKRVVREVDYEPGGAMIDGEPQMWEIPGTERKFVETIKKPFKPESYVGKFLNKEITINPGLTIKDVNKKPDFNANIALKNKKAQEVIAKQQENQRLGLDKAEEGFVPPQRVIAPQKAISEVPKEFPSIDDVMNGKAVKSPVKSFNDLINTEDAVRVYQELDTAQAGERIMTRDGEGYVDKFIGIKSSFPKWVPDHLRSRELFNKVQEHMITGAIPKTKKVRELYDVVVGEVLKRRGNIAGENTLINQVESKIIPKAKSVKKLIEESPFKVDEFVLKPKKETTPEMPDDIRVLQRMFDDGKILHPKNYAKLMSWKENFKKATPLAPPKGGVNPFQERAYKSKGERINAIKELINYPKELRSIGYLKNEIGRIGKDQADKIIKLGKLGYPKNEIQKMDFDRMDLIINREVPWSSLKDYYQRKHALDTNYLDDIDPSKLKDISPLQAGGRDAYRNFETVFGGDFPKIKEKLLDPFDRAKGQFVDEQKVLLNEVNENIVKRLGIKKGSDVDKAVVLFGEGKIGEQELMKKFPKQWRNIVEADKWFKVQYPKLLADLNMVREAFFPTHPLYPESTKVIPERADYYRHGKNLEGFGGLKNLFEGASSIDPSLAVSSDVTNPKTKWLSMAQRRKGDANDFGAVEGYLDYIRNYSYAKNIDPYIQRFKGVDDEAKGELGRGEFFHETTGLAEELAKKMDPIQRITDLKDPQKIRDILVGNKVTEAQADWMSRELANIDNYQQTKNFIRNKTSKNKENVLENMGFKSNAESSENKLNNFLVFIKNYSRDLAGKTNPIDRPFQENVIGRQFIGVLDWANKRFKANAVLGNLSSTMAQFFNIPQGLASAGPINSAKGVGRSLADVFSEKTPINKSNFVKERYFNGYDQFDEGVLANTKKFAMWMTSVGDKIGTRFIWNSHYQKALSNGINNPIKYADDWTRKMVAGRGVGEVPIIQKAKITQLVAPFQLEVANMWYALKDIAKDDPRKLVVAGKMLEFTVASYLMNRVVKEVRGSDVSFDPLNAMFEAYDEYQNEENKITGAIKAGGRMIGEIVSNIPGGQTIASIYPEYGWKVGSIDKATDERKRIPRKEFMGEGDPTRFGTGGLPVYSAFTNPHNILTTLVTPYGGKQIEKTWSGAKTLLNGYAENKTGKVMTPVDNNVSNIVRGIMFGKNALGEVQDYYSNKQTPLSDLQTEKFKLMGNDKNYFNSISKDREAGREKEQLKLKGDTSNAMKMSDDIYQLSNGKYYVKSLDSEFETAEKAQRELVKEDFRKSDENFREVGDRVLRKSEDGTVNDISKTKFNTMLNSAQLILFKKNEDLNKWMETADKQFNALNNLLNDPSIDELEKVEIQSKLETLTDDYQKYKSYGGFKKGSGGGKAKSVSYYKNADADPVMLAIARMRAFGSNPGKFNIGKRMPNFGTRRVSQVGRKRKRLIKL